MSLRTRVLVFLALLTICSPGSQGRCWEAPMASTEKDQSQSLKQGKEAGFNVGAWLVSIFRDYISAVDGDRCPSTPSCSSYSVMAFRKHGFFVGWVMTVDRLIHEADEGYVSPLARQGGKYKIVDPVENNDFWWFDPHENDVQ
jgi:putative component of membrane protein insertase Oxa1/YidC/SpoIIIJ protein YidD